MKPRRRVKPIAASRATVPGGSPVVASTTSRSAPQKPSHPWKTTLLTLALLSGAGGFLAAGIWLSVQLILDPDALLWVNQILPGWMAIPSTSGRSPQTLSQIQSSLRQQGYSPGTPVSLTDLPPGKPGDFLLPVLASQPNCLPGKPAPDSNLAPDCLQIVELQLYQPVSRNHPGAPYFQQVSRVAVQGPQESVATAPLRGAVVQGGDRFLPLNRIDRFDGKAPPNGVWVYLSGQLPSNPPLTYGQIAHYNPDRAYLSLLQFWSSTREQAPYWREMTGGGNPELVIDQTVGLEPQYKIYQVKPRNFFPDPVQLEAISLMDVALKDPVYIKALSLARSGLWSTAEQWLRSLQRRSKNWSAVAQAQLDFIHWHAQISKQQADQSWSNPSQQVLTSLIDGRWASALKVFEASPENSRDVATLLQPGVPRLWDRVTAALRVDPTQSEIKIWGALILAARDGQPAAIAWLQRQPKTSPALRARIGALIDRLNTNLDAPGATHLSGGMIGTVYEIDAVNLSQWQRPPGTSPKLQPGEAWYAIEISHFHDGNRWGTKVRQRSFQQLWKLMGFDTDAGIQILLWQSDGQQESIAATVQAIQWQRGTLRLLATGAKPASTSPKPGTNAAGNLPAPLVFTGTSLQWLEPDSLSLLDFSQQAVANRIMPTLWRALQQARLVSTPLPQSPEALANEGVADWIVQQIDLTGDNQPEVILTLDSQMVSETGKSLPLFTRSRRPRTLILSSTGSIIYNELPGGTRSQVALATLGDGGLPALVVNDLTTYRFLRWTPQRQKFEPIASH